MGFDVVHQIRSLRVPNRVLSAQDGSAEGVAPQHLSRMEFLYEVFRIVLDHSNFFKHDLLFFFDFFGIEA